MSADLRPLKVRNLGLVAYREGLRLQEEAVPLVRDGKEPDTLFLLEHPHVITLGTSSAPEHVVADADELSRLAVEVVETGRGGDVTYHGPGQLVGYPILDLKPDRKDLHLYLRDLEGMLIDALAEMGVTAGREPGLTGVWTPRGKIAAIGVRVSSGWITSHGFALNMAPDLHYFRTIVPCGIPDRPVTSVAAELGATPDDRQVRALVAEALARVFGRRIVAMEDGRPHPPLRPESGRTRMDVRSL